MGQGHSGSQIVEPTSKEGTHQAHNQATDEREYSGLSLGAALGQPNDVLQQLKKATLQVPNTEMRTTRQEGLQTEKLVKAIATQDETEQSKVVTVTSIFEKELKCGICLETFINPTVTSCGHTFCRLCINESRLIRYHCPTCKHGITSITGNYELINLLDKITVQLPADAKEARRVQIKTREEEEEACRVATAQMRRKTGRGRAARRQ